MIPQTIVMNTLTNMFQIEGVRPMSKTYNTRRWYTMSLHKEFALLGMCIAIAALIGIHILVPEEHNQYVLC
jgi:hypothetical protein